MLLKLYPCVGIHMLFLCSCIDEMMTWLLEVFVIFRCDVFIPVEILRMSIVDHSKT